MARLDRRRPGGGVVAIVLVVVLVVGLGAYQLTRSAPSQTADAATLAVLKVPGSAELPWPASGEAAVSVPGVTSMRTSGSDAAVPIASLAKMMTAFLVLRDHPITGSAAGPVITIAAADVATYQADAAAEDSVLPVTVGEQLTEREALEGLLIPSADNIATLLAQWDSGSVATFLNEMNAEARTLGMTQTTYTDPSGLASSTVSTAHDQLLMAQAAMKDPVFASIVAMPSASFAVGGTVQNYDYEIGHNGVIGVKTGSDAAAQGCWAFAATRTVAGSSHTVFGVVLGIPGTSLGLLEPALSAGVALANAVPATIRAVTVLPAGSVVGYVHAAWRTTVPIRTVQTISGFTQAGQTVSLHAVLHAPQGDTLAKGATLGSVSAAGIVGRATTSAMTSQSGSGPSLWWRLTRT
jgi:D-alanyl-D-alanine carboxypeptidase (penicillin-binding protein 5/6)